MHTHTHTINCQANTQGPTVTWVQSKGGKRGDKRTRDMTAYSGTRRRAQRQAAESGGWRVYSTSRWAEFLAGKGGGEQV